MTRIIPIASGKGGVGKTLISASLGHLIAAKGYTVVLVDLDLGGANLHSCVGVPNNNPGIGSYINGGVSKLEDLIVATEYSRLYFIPGDQMIPGAANLPYYRKVNIIRDLGRLVADYVILDLGAGASYNTVDFFLASPRGIVVTSAEPTAILNAYGFVKAACYRLILRAFPRKSPQRQRVHEYLSSRIEGSQLSFNGLLRELGSISTESEKHARELMDGLGYRVIINMGRSGDDIDLGARLRQVTRKNVGISLEYIGYVPRYEDSYKAILSKKPLSVYAPESPASVSLGHIAGRIIKGNDLAQPGLYDADEDLDGLKDELEQIAATP